MFFIILLAGESKDHRELSESEWPTRSLSASSLPTTTPGFKARSGNIGDFTISSFFRPTAPFRRSTQLHPPHLRVVCVPESHLEIAGWEPVENNRAHCLVISDELPQMILNVIPSPSPALLSSCDLSIIICSPSSGYSGYLARQRQTFCAPSYDEKSELALPHPTRFGSASLPSSCC